KIPKHYTSYYPYSVKCHRALSSICINYFISYKRLTVICKIIHHPCTFLDFRPCIFYWPSHLFCHCPCKLFLTLSKFLSKIVNMISSFMNIFIPIKKRILSFPCFFIYLLLSHYLIFINDFLCCCFYCL